MKFAEGAKTLIINHLHHMFHLNTLTLTGFKSHKKAQFTCSEKLNCFVGLNGVGKTNLLDAIYYLCMTKSQAGLSDKLLVNLDMDFFRLEGTFLNDLKKKQVVVKFPVQLKKVMEVNGVPMARLSDHIGQLPVVMIAPDDVELVTESGEMRRKFMDTSLSQVSAEYLQALMVYNHALKQRNALLKIAAETGRLDTNLLDTYDRQMIPSGHTIFEHRKAFFDDFAPVFAKKYAAISKNKEQVTVRYDSVLFDHSMEATLKDRREKDRILQRTTQGVHRDDLVMSMGDQSVRTFGSQGQLKSFLLALRLAQYACLREAKQTKPLLLLDDIFDKLDTERVSALIHLLNSDDYGQIFITDTQKTRIETVTKGIQSGVKIWEIGV
jgi:DNA replication and repair protein RecF